MRLVRALHDVALALLAGGIAGVGFCVFVLFARAPSREIAGQIGNAVFGRLGPVVLLLTAVVFGAGLVLRGDEGASLARAIARLGAALMLIVAGVNALWLTPRMAAIWAAGAHAPDGSGLMGEDRQRFLALHGASNVAYLGILLLAVLLVVLRAGRAQRRPG